MNNYFNQIDTPLYAVPLYAVLGNPIAHSQSPKIQQLFAQSTGIKCRYEAICVPLHAFSDTLTHLTQEGLQGCNITVPFKLSAFNNINQRTARAQLAQAANCLSLQSNGAWLADNTDGLGLVTDLKRVCGNIYHNGLSGARILILGAGGAAQGVIGPLLDAGAIIHIANRTVDKARMIANLFAETVTPHTLYDVLPACDIVINATSGSLQGIAVQPNPGALRLHGVKTLAYDMMYASKPTPFMQYCLLNGANASDGLGMLIEQAAESFFIWHKIMPDTDCLHKNRNQLFTI